MIFALYKQEQKSIQTFSSIELIFSTAITAVICKRIDSFHLHTHKRRRHLVNIRCISSFRKGFNYQTQSICLLLCNLFFGLLDHPTSCLQIKSNGETKNGYYLLSNEETGEAYRVIVLFFVSDEKKFFFAQCFFIYLS